MFSFGVIADVQYCDCEPSGSRHYRSSPKKLMECVIELNSKDLVFTIQLGDLIDRNYSSFDKVLPIYQKLKMKKYHVLSNHEFSVSDEKKKHIPKTLDLENGYYDFGVKGWRFIVLGGNDIHLLRASKGSKDYEFAKQMYAELKKQKLPNAKKWNGALSKTQINWLKASLEKACQAKEKVIIFCHFPVYPRSMYSLWNDTKVLNIIESYDCVVAYINGHDHAGGYEQKNGVHYLNLEGMVETPDQNSFAVIDIYPNYLKVVGCGREPDRNLFFK